MAATASIAATSAHAANKAYSTTPADGNFSGTNWTVGTVATTPPTDAAATGDALYFGASSITTLNNDLVGANFLSLTFNSGAAAFTIGGQAFALGGNIANSSTTVKTINNAIDLGTATHSVDATTGTVTLGGVLSGTAVAATNAINKTGTGTLVLAGANTYTGITRVNAGTVSVTGSLADTSAVVVAGGTYNVAVSDTVGAITLATGTISGPGTLTGASYSITTTSPNTSTASVVLAGGGTLTKSGSGIGILSGLNTYTGLTTISGGTLRVTGGLADTAEVRVQGGVYEVAADDTVGVVRVDANSSIIGSGTLTGSSYLFNNTGPATISAKLAGSAALTKTATSGTAVLSGANTYTGGTTIQGGQLSVSGSLADTGAVTITGGVYDVAADDTVGAVSLGNATIIGTGTLSASSFNAFNTNAATISAPLGGSGALTKTAGGGALILSGANSYTGGTTLSVARIQIANATALGTGTVTQSGGATLELNLTGPNTVANTFAPITPGAVVVSGNTITTAATPTFLNTAGTNTISSNLTHANSTGGNGFSLGSNAGLLTITGNISSNRNGVSVATGIGGAGNGVVSGQILDNGTAQVSVVKYGAGTWALTGANAYATTTQIVGGTLVTGNTSALGTSAVSVTNAGSDLTVGDGTVNTVGGITGLTMADGTVLDVAATNSQVALASGLFTLGNITLDLNGAFSSLAGDQTFTLIDGVTGANSIGTVAFVGTNPSYTYAFNVVGNDGVLSVTNVPEPTTVAVIGLGALVALRRRRTA